MNDFTKEELKRLLLRSYSWVSYPENQNKDELELINKIQSMIDNYCDHEWRCWDDKHNTRECIKCDEKRQGEIND